MYDINNRFSNSQTVTSSAVSTNVIDLGPLSGGNLIRDIGAGNQVMLNIEVVEAVTQSGSGTVTFTAESDDNTSLSSATTHITTGAIAKATLVAGYKIQIPLPPGAYQQYLGVRYTVSETLLTGKFTAYLSEVVQNTRHYATGSVIANS